MSVYDNRIGSMPSDMAEGIVERLKQKRVHFAVLDAFLDTMDSDWSPYSEDTKAAINDLSIALTMWGNLHLTDEGLQQAIYRFCNQRCVVLDTVADVIGHFMDGFQSEMDSPNTERKW